MIIVFDEKKYVEKIDEVVAQYGEHKIVKLNGELLLILKPRAGNKNIIAEELSKAIPDIKKILIFSDEGYKLAGKKYRCDVSLKLADDLCISDGTFTVIAGPCSVECESQIHRIAQEVVQHGAKILRGGAYKARTSPYDFQGVGRQGILYLREAAKENNLLSITEVLDTRDVDYVAEHVDILQIGTRNMYNFPLLKEAARTKKPILLKRGFSASYVELLLAAEYIYSEGNPNIILCERGIKTFEKYTRNTVDINAIPALKGLTHLPIFVDPSHGTGLRELVEPISLASLAAGAHGIMLEVHFNPDQAYSDKRQTIDIAAFSSLMVKVERVRKALYD